MHGLKRGMWKAGIALAGLLIFFVLMVWIPVSANAYEGGPGLARAGIAAVQATPTVDLTVTVLTKQKLQNDVDEGQHTFDNWFWINAATVLSPLVLAVGGLIGFLRWLADQRNARVSQIIAREKELIAQDSARLAQDVAYQKSLEDQRRAFELAQMATQAERELAADNQREVALQAYIDKMSDLLLKENLRISLPRDTVQEIARVRTLTILPQLDPARKKSVLQFLHESGLIDTHDTVINLGLADLQDAHLRSINLKDSNLSNSNLRNADLSGAQLEGANLYYANLVGANLSGANLHNAFLKFADLKGAYLSGANIEEARSLDHTNLQGVKGLTPEQLKACEATGAFVNKATTASPPQAPVSLTPPSQSSDAKASPAPPAQVNTPPHSTDGSSNTSTQPSTEP